MVMTTSNMLPLNSIAPDFQLVDTVTGKTLSLENVQSEIATVVMFICNHCPFVTHIITELAQVINDYKSKGISFIAINSNDVTKYPEDAPNKMKAFAKLHHLNCPYLYDESQEVAKAYQAACTPDFYVFDKSLHCVYRGQFDESRPGNHIPITGSDLREALDHLLSHKLINPLQKPSMGCNIKWK